jgi:hypothetical protein
MPNSFHIPAGTTLSICPENDPNRKWTAHTTRIPLNLEEHKTPTCRGSSGAIVFKFQGYLILTRCSNCHQ